MLLVLQSAAQKSDSSYAEQSLVLETGSGKLHGTVCIPSGTAPFPVALIIAGSGPTDRDGNNPMMKNNSLKMLAQELAKAGIATVRYDKRGIAESSGAMKKEADLRFDDMVSDAKGWMELILQDKRFGAVTIIGHSEGSLVGMLAAEKASRFVSLAGAGEPIGKTLRRQLENQPKPLYDAACLALDSLEAGLMVKKVNPMLLSLFRPSVQPYMISWLKHDPAKIISSLRIPVLIVQGTTDIQVSVDNANSLAAANTGAKLLLIDQMNHVLKTAPADRMENMKTYSDPSLPLSPGLAEGIISFIRPR